MLDDIKFPYLMEIIQTSEKLSPTIFSVKL